VQVDNKTDRLVCLFTSRTDDNVVWILELVFADENVASVTTICDLHNMVGISFVLWHRIWRNLNMHCIYAKFMLRLLTDKQMKNPVIVSSDLQETLCKPCCSFGGHHKCWNMGLCVWLWNRGTYHLCAWRASGTFILVWRHTDFFFNIYGIM